MLMSKCRGCGAPLSTRLFRQWNDDGTSTARFSATGNRVCHMDCEEFAALVEGISQRLGHPIDRIVAEGQRKAARSTIEDVLARGRGILGWLGRTRMFHPLEMKITLDAGRNLGYGVAEVLEDRRGRRLRARLREPYCPPMAAGNLWGMFESHNNVTADADWRLEEGAVEVTVEKVSDGVTWDDPFRFALLKMATVRGDVRFDRCDRCGTPREVTRALRWESEAGMIFNRASGRRQMTVMVEAINAIIRELTEEIGDYVPQMVAEIEQDYIADAMCIDAMPGTPHDYRALLDDLCILGMGNPVEISKEGDVLTVRIDNPFCEPLLAGRIAGSYRALEGVPTMSTWTPDIDGYTIVQAWPA